MMRAKFRDASVQSRKRTTSPAVFRGRTLLAALAFALAIPSTAAAGSVDVGEKAPPFELPAAHLKGEKSKTVKLETVVKSNRLTVLLFVATRCPYSNAYNDRMRQLAQRYAAKGVTFIGINSNVTEPSDEVAKHRKKNKLPFVIVKDAGSQIADAYGAKKTPEVFVLDQAREVLYHGRIDENWQEPAKVKSPDLRVALDALLASQPVKRPKTKAFGCSIKRPAQ